MQLDSTTPPGELKSKIAAALTKGAPYLPLARAVPQLWAPPRLTGDRRSLIANLR
jgi:hypothetical protein